MTQRQTGRAQHTRERIRAAAHRLFLRHGYQATSTDAILAEAGVASKETLYRHYVSKEALFADVLGHLTTEQPSFAATLTALPAPDDLPSLRQALTLLAREILSLMSQPDYLALLRVLIAEAPRFPRLGPLFFSTVPQRGLSVITGLLRTAAERDIIADVDLEATARALLGGLLTYAITDVLIAGGAAQPPSPAHADAIVAVVMRSLTCER